MVVSELGLQSEKAAFVPGDRLGEVFTVAGYRAAMLICVLDLSLTLA